MDADTDAGVKKTFGRRHRRKDKEIWWTQTQTQEYRKLVDADTDAGVKKTGGRRHRRRSKENWWTQTQTQE